MAQMRRRGRLGALIVVELAFAAAIAGIWTWALTAWPLFDYWVVPSLLSRRGLVATVACAGLWLLVRRFTAGPVATLAVGLTVVAAGLGLGLAPIASGGQSGRCRSVLADVGLHGDDQETCFDARASRASDVAIVISFGLVLSAVGCALVARAGEHP